MKKLPRSITLNQTPVNFIEVLKTTMNEKNINCYDATMFLVEERDFDLDVVAAIIKKNSKIKKLFEADCRQLKLLK